MSSLRKSDAPKEIRRLSTYLPLTRNDSTKRRRICRTQSAEVSRFSYRKFFAFHEFTLREKTRNGFSERNEGERFGAAAGGSGASARILNRGAIRGDTAKKPSLRILSSRARGRKRKELALASTWKFIADTLCATRCCGLPILPIAVANVDRRCRIGATAAANRAVRSSVSRSPKCRRRADKHVYTCICIRATRTIV